MGFSKIKKYVLKLTPDKVIKFYQEYSKVKDSDDQNFANISYSQEGEDAILGRYFENKNEGFYIDVGAHHPFRFSNTYRFYLKGWSGVNIDAMPGSMSLFERYRPRDINIEQPISEKYEKLTFYIFNEKALNTFVQSNAEKYLLNPDYKILEKKELEAFPLAQVLERYYPEGKQVDFMTVDVEGLDLQVLKSNNWLKFKPLFVLVETLEMESIIEFQNSDIYIFLISKGYLFFGKTVNTCFFKISN
jgi:FkbM family methyltransferase